MYPNLVENSFIKLTPDKNECFYIFNSEGIRHLTSINESGSMILALCNGNHSQEEIIFEINQQYDETLKETEKKVKDFLTPLINANLILDKRNGNNKKVIVKGSSEVYLPTIISWDITEQCPLNCKHCYIGEKRNNVLTRDEINKVLEIIDYSGVYQVQVTGGEALTHPDLGYIISNLINRGIVTAVSTSGYISNDEIFKALEKLKSIYGSSLRVSLEGGEHSHNEIRGKKDAYTNTIEFIKKAVKLEIPCQVETCLINQTKREIEEMVSTVKGLGVSALEIGMLLDIGNAQENNLKSSWSVEEYSILLEELNLKYEDSTFKIRKNSESTQKNCGAGYILCHFTSRLEVKPCPMLDFNLGDLHSESMVEIMSRYGKAFHDIEFPQSKFCENCEKKEVCKNCSAAGFHNKDKVNVCDWFAKAKKNLQSFI